MKKSKILAGYLLKNKRMSGIIIFTVYPLPPFFPSRSNNTKVNKANTKNKKSYDRTWLPQRRMEERKLIIAIIFVFVTGGKQID